MPPFRPCPGLTDDRCHRRVGRGAERNGRASLPASRDVEGARQEPRPSWLDTSFQWRDVENHPPERSTTPRQIPHPRGHSRVSA